MPTQHREEMEALTCSFGSQACSDNSGLENQQLLGNRITDHKSPLSIVRIFYLWLRTSETQASSRWQDMVLNGL